MYFLIKNASHEIAKSAKILQTRSTLQGTTDQTESTLHRWRGGTVKTASNS